MRDRESAIKTLASLAQTLQINLDNHFDIVMPELKKALSEEKSFEPNLDALRVFRRLFRAA